MKHYKMGQNGMVPGLDTGKWWEIARNVLEDSKKKAIKWVRIGLKLSVSEILFIFMLFSFNGVYLVNSELSLYDLML